MPSYTVTYTDERAAAVQRYLDEVVNPPRLAADPPQPALTVEQIIQVRGDEIADSLASQQQAADLQALTAAYQAADSTTQDQVKSTLGLA